MSFANKKTLVVVTGASRGIGRAAAAALAAEVSGGGSRLVLLGRDADKLKEAEAEVKGANGEASVSSHSVEFADAAGAEKSFREILSEAKGPFEAAVCVHNAGTLGRQGAKAGDLSAEEVGEYLAVNLVSVVSLNAAFLKETEGVENRCELMYIHL